jgi:hypothetical protein
MDPEKKKLWEKRFEEYKASGLSGKRWCREQGKEQGFSEYQFWYWKKRLEKNIEEEESTSTWVPVMMEDPVQQTTTITIRIGTLEVDVKSGYDPKLLQDVIRMLTSLC